MLQGNWLSTLCNNLEYSNNIRITDYARQLVLQTAVALKFDPHPAWGVLPEQEDALRRKIEALIENELTSLGNSQSVQQYQVITYFHVLHWFHKSPSLSGFPVPKPSDQ